MQEIAAEARSLRKKPVRAPLIRVLLAGTALVNAGVAGVAVTGALSLAAVVASTSLVQADGGRGGDSTTGTGGAGGAGNSGAPGSAGAVSAAPPPSSGGGGGGGAGGGGAGGTGAGTAGGGGGGAGGTAGSPNGQTGADGGSDNSTGVSTGGGGGGGGFNGVAAGNGGSGGSGGLTSIDLIGPPVQAATGSGGGGGGGGGSSSTGAGGAGGAAGSGGVGRAQNTFIGTGLDLTANAFGGMGGSGGDGGIGNVQAGSFNLGTNSIGGAGGAGGAGGNGVAGVNAGGGANIASVTAAGGSGGNGGNGGTGLEVTGSSVTAVNTATITGGNGGRGGDGGGAQAGAFAGDFSNIGASATATATEGAGGNGGGGGLGAAFTGTGVSFTNSGTIAGGVGGGGGQVGGATVQADTFGGGNQTQTTNIAAAGTGGAGGAGVLFSGANSIFTNSGSVTGGAGGSGGSNGATGFGDGGAGGVGAVFAASGGMLVNSGTGIITGGNGGTPALGAPASSGGAGIVGTGLTIANAGTISGGLGSAGMQQFAIVLTGGTNAISPGGTINGGIQLQAGSLMPALPGSMVGPALSVNGPVSFAPGSTYAIRINGGLSDSISATGAAALAGTVNVGFTGNAQVNHSYDILHAAAGFNGTMFGGAQASNFTAALSYSPTDVFLNLTANLGGGGVGGGLGGNQQNVATVINSAFNSGGTLPPGFINLFNLSGAPLSNALTQISGETATGSQQTTFDAMGMFMGLLTDPFMNRTGGVGSPVLSGYAEENAYAAKSNPTDAFAMFTKAPPVAPTFEQRWSMWAAGFGGSQSTTGNTVLGSNNTTSNIAGTAVGADYLVSPNTIAGFALAGGGTNFSVANGGTGRSDLFQVGAYVRHTNGAAYISAALAYGWQDITTNRTLTAAGFDQLRAEFNANAWSGRLEGGYRFVSPATFGIGITPYAAAQFVTFDLPAYTEQAISGTNNFALGYNAKDATDARTELGIRTDKSFVMPDGILTLRGRFAWAHDYDPNRSIGATFQSLPGASFVVNGAAQAADSALTTASIEMKWRNNWSVAATFEGEFSNVTSSYAGKGVVRYVW